jgi:tryptophanyl-tRNA synthetase
MNTEIDSNRSSSGVICNTVDQSINNTILTGDRPTGPLHLGNFHGSLRSRAILQQQCKQYVLLADVQALTDNAENSQRVADSILEVAIDYLSVGIDPKLTTIYVQSAVPETAELTLYYMNLLNLGRLLRNPTVKKEIEYRGFQDEVPVGFINYPINQAADISQFKANLVPVGLDQVPMIELTNFLVKKFNATYQTDILVECKALVTDNLLLPGTDGASKMSKSLNNAIFLKDSADTVVKKVKKMFTDPNHLRREDPGRVEGNPVFSYLDAFALDKEKIEKLKEHYQRGGLGDGEVKNELITVLNDLLEPFRRKRLELEDNKDYVVEILKKGTEEARAKIVSSLQEIRKAMGIAYF